MKIQVNHRDPVKAVVDVARRHRATGAIPEYVAREIADAVLACADTVMHVSATCERDQWEHDERYSDHMRARLRRDLLAAVTETGRIPAALPVEAIEYRDWGSCTAPVPAEAVEHGADWTHLVLTLAVPVRTPPIDRAAAVKAGIL